MTTEDELLIPWEPARLFVRVAKLLLPRNHESSIMMRLQMAKGEKARLGKPEVFASGGHSSVKLPP